MANSSAYNSVDEVYKKYGDNCEKLKKQLTAKAKHMQKHGFCIDIVQHPEKSWQDIVNETAEKFKTAARIDASTIDDLGTYRGLDGNKHQFIHFKPKGFKFTYVDFNSYCDVMHVTNPVIYLNSFWGIYIENEVLKMHDLVQYDVFYDFYKIAPYNLYDGGNNLLPWSNTYVQGICGHNGAIFDSWEDFVESTKRINDVNLKKFDLNISRCKEELKKLIASKKECTKNSKRVNAFIDHIVLEHA